MLEIISNHLWVGQCRQYIPSVWGVGVLRVLVVKTYSEFLLHAIQQVLSRLSGWFANTACYYAAY